MTLEQRLTNYLEKRGDWVAKADLEKLVIEKTEHTADYCGRKLRLLAEAGVLDVEHRTKNHAFYRFKKPLTQEQWFDSITPKGQLVEKEDGTLVYRV